MVVSHFSALLVFCVGLFQVQYGLASNSNSLCDPNSAIQNGLRLYRASSTSLASKSVGTVIGFFEPGLGFSQVSGPFVYDYVSMQGSLQWGNGAINVSTAVVAASTQNSGSAAGIIQANDCYAAASIGISAAKFFLGSSEMGFSSALAARSGIFLNNADYQRPVITIALHYIGKQFISFGTEFPPKINAPFAIAKLHDSLGADNAGSTVYAAEQATWGDIKLSLDAGNQGSLKFAIHQGINSILVPRKLLQGQAVPAASANLILKIGGQNFQFNGECCKSYYRYLGLNCDIQYTDDGDTIQLGLPAIAGRVFAIDSKAGEIMLSHEACQDAFAIHVPASASPLSMRVSSVNSTRSFLLSHATIGRSNLTAAIRFDSNLVLAAIEPEQMRQIGPIKVPTYNGLVIGDAVMTWGSFIGTVAGTALGILLGGLALGTCHTRMHPTESPWQDLQ